MCVPVGGGGGRVVWREPGNGCLLGPCNCRCLLRPHPLVVTGVVLVVLGGRDGCRSVCGYGDAFADVNEWARVMVRFDHVRFS
jgi:hypothetical protein